MVRADNKNYWETEVIDGLIIYLYGRINDELITPVSGDSVPLKVEFF